MDLFTLFASAFLAATILPAQSELVLAGMAYAGQHDAALLVAVATAGNVLGAAGNWVLGRVARRFEGRRWFPVRPEAMRKAEGWYLRWGVWSLLLAWVPVIGDPITVAAGALRVPFRVFLPLVFVAKVWRYVALVAGVGFFV
ncbi:MAG TPA: YqaA family protein [Azospirillaceae bacterium]|nr:YqaA family protein [Azospirillaceae bacterium]